MFLAYGQKISRAHLPAVFFQETGAILIHLMFFFFLGDLVFRPFSSILTFSACEICEMVFLRQIFGPCATAGGLETFPTRGHCCGSFLRCGAARHGGPWVAPAMGMASNFQLAMAGQHHQQWLKEKVPESLFLAGDVLYLTGFRFILNISIFKTSLFARSVSPRHGNQTVFKSSLKCELRSPNDVSLVLQEMLVPPTQ